MGVFSSERIPGRMPSLNASIWVCRGGSRLGLGSGLGLGLASFGSEQVCRVRNQETGDGMKVVQKRWGRNNDELAIIEFGAWP